MNTPAEQTELSILTEQTDGLHVTDPVAKMEELIQRAENGEPDLVNAARFVLALAVIHKRPVDEDRLQRLALRAGNNGFHQGPLVVWFPFMNACSDYIHHKQVGLPDGRCATEDGWNYENCEPEHIRALVSRELCERLESYVGTLTTAEPSNDPDLDPSEYDGKYDKVVAQALTEFLDRKGA